jgi:hypothetical protein
MQRARLPDSSGQAYGRPAGSCVELAFDPFLHRRPGMVPSSIVFREVSGGIEGLRREFERALPRIQRHAEFVFRSVCCRQKRDDCIAELVALSWKWWVRLRQRGKNPRSFASVLATYAARAVRSGRRLCGQESGKDALSPSAQIRRGFIATGSADLSAACGTVLEEALTDNMRTPVDEQVAFRLDFPVWLRTLTERNRDVVRDMMQSERTEDLSAKYGLSAARVSQLRQEFHRGWHLFLGANEDGNDVGPPARKDSAAVPCG